LQKYNKGKYPFYQFIRHQQAHAFPPILRSKSYYTAQVGNGKPGSGCFLLIKNKRETGEKNNFPDCDRENKGIHFGE